MKWFLLIFGIVAFGLVLGITITYSKEEVKEPVFISSLNIRMIELYQEQIVETRFNINYYEKDYDFMNCNLPNEIKDRIIETDGMVYDFSWEDKYQSCINALSEVYSNKWTLRHQEEQLDYYTNKDRDAILGADE